MRLLAGLGGLLIAAVAAGLLFGLVYSPHDGLLMAAYLVVCGGCVVAAVELLKRRRRHARSLARQLATGVGASVGLTMVGVGVIALFMFISPHDGLTMAVLLLLAGALGTYSVWALSQGPLDDLHAVRDGLRAVGDGRRDVAISTGARDELAELADAATRMVVQLAEREAERDAAEKGRRDLVAAVSHDLRTPLTSLRLLSEAIESDLVDAATRRDYLEQMSGHIRSLSALIEDLFELSRLEAGDIQWSMQQVSLDELVAETVEAMRAQADAKRVSVAATVPAGIDPARADPERLQRVLFNLIQNAIRHTPADGSVTVLAEPCGKGVELEVADTGEGLSEEDRGRAFDPFYRGGNGKARSPGGSGLGLAICRAIVEAHGGEIWFADSPTGTRVRFSLPNA
ncbi:MAG: HAMP domain-containing histidine kinase [Thermoleophilaceae bacterium]|nr:HAMP domain-containing histidine kinase [Thermoleophilaceae bacterium]